MTFDAITYFQGIQESLLSLQGENRFYRATDIGHLEELMMNLRKVVYPAMVVIDSQDGLITGNSSGYFDSRYYMVMILTQVKTGNDDDRVEKMAECRSIFRSILSKIIVDADEYRSRAAFLNPNNIKYDEVGYIATNLFGISFSFTIDEPEDLTYDANEWAS